MKKLIPLLALLFFLFAHPVLADIAPPDQPPGANPLPGSDPTQVRMLSESVLIDVQPKAPAGSIGQARVTASFTMRNLGNVAETMPVRFPLSFWDGSSNGFGNYPEIQDFSAKVDGRTEPTRRISTDNGVPWAEFQATFPPEKDILVEVTYLAEGVGEYPFISFKYILETGAGWQGTIGSADLVLRLPYEANNQNVIFTEQIGWSQTTPGGSLSGREVRWHYADFEPTWEHNLQVSLVMPSAWKKVLDEQANLARNPKDGEAWGRLGKVYKEIASLRRGLRQDTGGQELYRMSVEAYEKALELLPNDALWHAGFADLLYRNYYWKEFFSDNPDHSDMLRSLDELRISLELDPQNAKALELLDDMKYSLPDAVRQEGDGYLLLWLTATPTPRSTHTAEPSETLLLPTAFPSLSFTPTPPIATSTPLPTEVIPPTQPIPFAKPVTTPIPRPGLPVCGTAALAPLSAAGWLRKRKRSSIFRSYRKTLKKCSK